MTESALLDRSCSQDGYDSGINFSSCHTLSFPPVRPDSRPIDFDRWAGRACSAVGRSSVKLVTRSVPIMSS